MPIINVVEMYRNGLFDSEEKALGAFELAYQQALDGMGKTTQSWMGMTEEEFSQWYRSQKLPVR